MSGSQSSRPGVLLLAAAALVATALALYNYFAALTGVTGTLGALLAVGVSLLILVMAGVLHALSSGGLRIAWRVLLVIALAGNAFAGALLHEWWLCLAMLVGLVGLIIDFFSPVRSGRQVSA